MPKTNELKTGTLLSNGTFNNEGYTFLGNSYQNKTTVPQNDQVPPNAYLGTSKMSGNRVRSLYNTNSNGPIVYSPTGDDEKFIVEKFSNYTATNTILGTYPFLTAIPDYSSQTQEILENTSVPVYKCLGKGLGNVSFFKSGNAVDGDEPAAGTTESVSDTYITFGTYPDEYQSGAVYPFNGYNYSGTLVQLITETSVEGHNETKVIPYQNGRGIPRYSSNYQPDDITQLTPFGPYGELTWTASGNTMSPSLANGIEPGLSNTCVGVVLDTFTTVVPSRRLFKPKPPPAGFSEDILENDPHDKYFNHPAPFSVPAVSFQNTETTPTTQGFLSPGPNLSGVYYAPWPRYYAYQPDEAIPVLTSGITTVRIGAAYNVALMTYGIKHVSQTYERWLPVQCIPLFQGEKLEAGSYIYASVKGHIMTPGPYQAEEFDNNTTAEERTSFGVIGQTPWDLFVDSTWGNFGWTGTPGLSFFAIPDQERSILEVLEDENGQRQVISGLNQSNQGSIIVHPITTTSPSPAIGNAYLQSQFEIDRSGLTETQIASVKSQRAALSGISGRCVLPQANPEKCQPIGILMETIEGKGKWTYTAQPLDQSDYSGSLVTGGMVYGDPATLGNTPLRTNTGVGVGGEVTWTAFDSDPPLLGTITADPTLAVAGTQSDGDIVTIIDDSLNWDPTDQFQYHGNNVALTIANGNTEVVLQSGGTGYTAATSYTGFNLSLNNGYFDFDQTAGDCFFVGTLVGDTYFQDFSRYPVNTVIRALNKTFDTNYNLAYFIVDQYLTYDNLNISDFHTNNDYTTLVAPTFLETKQSNYDTLSGDPEINVLTVGADGEILTFEFIDYGAGNKQGDRIIVINGTNLVGLDTDNNGVIEFPGMPPGQQEILATGPSYTDTNTYDVFNDAGVFQFTTTVLADPVETNLPIVYLNTVGGTNDLFQVRYDGAFNYASQRYHSQCAWMEYLTNDNAPRRGGSGYTTANGVSTYNLSANALRVLFTVAGDILTAQVLGASPYNVDVFEFDESRYIFDATNGTQVRLLLDTTSEENQEVIRLESFDLATGLVSSQVKAGGVYSLADNDYIFQTQRLDQTNPTVDITVGTANLEPAVKQVKLRNPGTGNQNGDIILVTQEGSDFNCVFVYNDNMPLIDLPPYASVPGYNVQKDSAAWERYSDVMSSAENLFDKQVLVELRPTPEQPIENITPYAVSLGAGAPPTNNIYRHDYEY